MITTGKLHYHLVDSGDSGPNETGADEGFVVYDTKAQAQRALAGMVRHYYPRSKGYEVEGNAREGYVVTHTRGWSENHLYVAGCDRAACLVY